MNLLNILRRIPYLKKKISVIKPLIEDVLYEFYKPNSKITYLDIGANSGQTIDFVKKKFPNATIHSFEPTPKLFVNLKQKYGNFDHVFLHNIALADDNKELDFFQSEFSPANSCLEPDASLYKDFKHKIAETLDNSTKIKVNGLKLDTWYKENIDGQIIDIVKIDTQGFEYNVIKGGIDSLKENVKLLYFEIQYHDFYKKAVPFYKIYEFLYDNGFYYYCHLSSNKRKKYQEIENDVLFVNSKFLKSYD